MGTHSRIQELANNSEKENLQNKSQAKISEFIVLTKFGLSYEPQCEKTSLRGL